MCVCVSVPHNNIKCKHYVCKRFYSKIVEYEAVNM